MRYRIQVQNHEGLKSLVKYLLAMYWTSVYEAGGSGGVAKSYCV